MNSPLRNLVSAADFVRHFARHRESATIAPVYITNHARPTHVLTSIADYTRSTQPEGGSDARAAAVISELGQWMTDAIVLCDRDLTIRSVNRVAEAIMRRSSDELVGHSIIELPEIRETHLHSLINRVNQASEPITVDVTSPFAPEAWLRLRAFPWRTNNVVVFSDVTERVRAQRLAEAKNAILNAMGVHKGVGYVRVTVRGLIERADEPFADMLGVPETRLLGVPLVDLVAVGDRVAFREALDDTIRNGKSHRMESQFLCNNGEILACTLSMVQLDGPYAIEGAVLILTHSDESLAPSPCLNSGSN